MTSLTDGGSGSPHGVATSGQNGEPCVTRLRRYQKPPMPVASTAAAMSGRSGSSRARQPAQSPIASTSTSIGRTVVLPPIARPAATTAGTSSARLRRLSATSAAVTTSHASAGGSVTLPLLCQPSSHGFVHSAAAARPAGTRGTSSERRPAHAAVAVRVSMIHGHRISGAKLRAMPIAQAIVTSVVSG